MEPTTPDPAFDWDAVRRGDPDPTPAATGLEDVELCKARDYVDGWLCTREVGHDGVHVAGTGTSVCEVWR